MYTKQAPPVGSPGYQFPMVAVAPQPPYNAPHDFFFLAMVTTIMCAIFNLLSLTFGIPALVLSAMVSPSIIMVPGNEMLCIITTQMRFQPDCDMPVHMATRSLDNTDGRGWEVRGLVANG